MIKKKIYIAGSVRGTVNWRDKFIKAKKSFDFRQYDIKTPLDYPLGLTEQEYMRLSYEAVLWADVIYVCPGYENSLGTLAEIAIAKSAGIPIMYFTEDDLK